MAHRNRLADFPDRESSPKARGRASVSVRTPRKQGDSARKRRKQHTPSPYFPTAWGSLAPVVLRSALTRSSKERDGERCRWRTRATSPEAHHSSKEREIHGMATRTVLTIRIYKNGAQRSASGAVFLDPAWSIPMIQITFPPVRAKFVRLSVNLPIGPDVTINFYHQHEILSGEFSPCPLRGAPRGMLLDGTPQQARFGKKPAEGHHEAENPDHHKARDPGWSDQ